MEVDEEHGARLFYYFIASERNPAEDPLILWITGGPGCSALSGLLFEIGQYPGRLYAWLRLRSSIPSSP